MEEGDVRSAGSSPIVGAEALEVLEGVDELWVAKGRNTVRFDLRKERPDDEALLGLLLGRSGKLRAPTIRVGRRLLVGYHAAMLEEALGG